MVFRDYFGVILWPEKREILGLKFDDFDFEERTVTVQRQLVADIETKEGTYEIIKYQSILRDQKAKVENAD